MTSFNLEPLVIVLNAPRGNYEVTVSIKSHCDTVFSVFEETAGFVAENREISNGTSADIMFRTSTDDGIEVIIYCDGDITATAFAEYIN
ncbi:MAG: hypothetical protein IIX21_00500 [Clostridia bacterium]|nr:hypothetical protein [Clostridia bacterium]MEE0409844.1 hypothetical protein [Clostridia bacterium]